MSKYLTRYVGTYRVKAEYDKSTNDFPRNEMGRIDPSFDDLYIKCAHGDKIMHYGKNILIAYMISKGRGYNLIRNLCKELTGTEEKDVQEAAKLLLTNKNCTKIVFTDDEVEVFFKADIIDLVAQILQASTLGKNISPFSTKNLPKTPYEIPQNDLDLYAKAIGEIKWGDGKVQKIGAANTEFAQTILVKKCGDKWDEERKLLCLTFKNYIHSKGLWKQYCEFLSTKGIL